MKKLFLVTASTLFLLLPAAAYAQDCKFGQGAGSFKDSFTCVLKIGTDSGVKVDQSPVEFILSIIKFGLKLAAVLAMAFVMYAGVKYIMSRGDESEAEKAKKALLYAVIGLLLIGVSAIIVNVVIGAFQADKPAADNQQPNPPPGGGQKPPQLPPAN